MDLLLAAVATDIQGKEPGYVARDLEERLLPVIIDDLKTNFPKRVQYVAAAANQQEIIQQMKALAEGNWVKEDCHLLKVKVSFEVEIVKGQ